LNLRLPSRLPDLILRLRLPLLWLFTLGIAAASLAKDLSAYRLGDVVDEAIVAPAALAVPDPDATAAMKSEVASRTPAVFREYLGVTNVLAGQFQFAFETARSNFISALQDTFHASVLDHATIMSPDFGYVLTAYNFDHPDLPVPDYLAMDWAYGKDGSLEESKWLNEVCAVMQHPIRPDTLPPGFVVGNTVRLVPVSSFDEEVSPADLASRGRLAFQSQFATLAQAQSIFRREFASGSEPLLARAFAAWIQPNCLPDVVLTQAARDGAVRQMVVAEYYTAGQVIAPQGTVVDAKILAAINQMIQRPGNAPALSAGFPHQVRPPATQDKPPLPDPIKPQAGNPADSVITAGNAQVFSIEQRRLAIAGALCAAILIVARQLAGRGRIVTGPATLMPVLASKLEVSDPPPLQTELAPQVLQVVRQAFVQELAGQRHDLLSAQQAAAAEVIELVQRMDALQVAMQERLRTYESHIQKLEAELTARKEENRQLIRLKIQMIRQQVQLETTPQRIALN